MSAAAITVIELWPCYATCQKCGCDTRAKLGWPYYEDFIIGEGEPWQERGGYVPVCEWCYRELDDLERARTCSPSSDATVDREGEPLDSCQHDL